MSQLQVTGEAKIRDIQGPVVANSGVITALDGAASQYVRGDGTLADFPTSTGGGSSVSYYLNSSVSQGTIGGVAYRELSKEPVIGAGTDITASTNGYIASYITDANDPDVVIVPGGNFNCEFYFSVNSNNHNPSFYAELYKYDGTTFTLLGSSVGVPEFLTQGTTIAPYYFAIPVPTSALALTDRLAIRIYVNVDGRTVTLHTENGHLCQVVTTLSKGMVSLNNLTDQSQFLATGTAGTDFNIVSSGDTHTFNIPSASASNRGLITTGSQTIAGAKSFESAIKLKDGSSTGGLGYVGLGSNAEGLTLGIYDSGSVYFQDLYFPTTNGYQYTFPAATGTIALTSNLSSYVPYTGATTSVDLGTFALSSNIVYVNGNSGSSIGGYLAFKQYSSSQLGTSGYSGIAALNQNLISLYYAQTGVDYKAIYLSSSLVSNNSTVTLQFPDASGTLALTSNLSAYVPYTGATANVDLGANNLTANYLTSGNIVFWKGTGSGLGNIGLGRIVPLGQNTTGQVNIGIGENSLFYNTTGSNNIALGGSANGNNTTGSSNIGIGSSANYANTTASNNIAIGLGALANNTVDNNVAIGHVASYLNTTGNFNVAVGYATLYTNTTGSSNTAIGSSALYSTTTGVQNTAIGKTSMFYNTTGGSNTAIGTASLQSNTTGSSNTGIGTAALGSNTTGVGNIAIGNASGFSITTGSNNTIIGNYAGTSAMSNNIVLADGAGNIRYQWDGTNNNLYGNVNFSSTLGNGTYTYTLPNATGTLALTSAIPANPVGGTGTTNYLPKFTGASTIGNSQIFDNGTTVFVNATTAPALGSPKFLVKMGTANSYEGILVASSSNNNVIAIAHTGSLGLITTNYGTSGSNTPLAFGTEGAAQMTLSTSGNLGLGVTPNTWAGTGTKAFQFQSGTLSASSTFGVSLAWNAYYDGADRYVTSGVAGRYLIDGNAHIWQTAPSGTAGNAISFTQAMTLFANGGLGLGTTTPTTSTGYNTFSLNGSTGGQIEFQTSGAGKAFIYSNSTDLRFYTNGGAFRFENTSGLEVGYGTAIGLYKLDVNGTGRFSDILNISSGKQLRFWNAANNDYTSISNSGTSGTANLVIGTTSGTITIASTGAATFSSSVTATQFNVSTSGGATQIYNTGGGHTVITNATANKDINYQTSGSGGHYFNTAGTDRLTIASTGAATLSSLAGSGSRTVTADASGTLSASSDSSLKQEDTTHKIEGLAEILQLQPKAYKWLSDIEIRGKEATTEIGFFADEVNPIIPSAAPKGNDDLYGFYDRAIIAALVKAIQEQQAQIEELKALINK